MFFHLFCLSACAEIDFGPYVKHLDGLPPNDGTGYFVMLHSDGCGHCVRLAPTWKAAAELGEGLAVWAELSCSENQTACQILNTQGVPRVLYFKNGTIHEYPGMQLARLLVNWVGNFVEDTAELVDSANFSETANAAILFTEKPAVPKIWTAVENALGMKNLKFYVSRDKGLLEKLGGSHFPGVYAIKDGALVEFTQKLTVKDAVKFFKDTFTEQNEL